MHGVENREEARHTRDSLEHFVRNLGSGLVLGQGVGVVEGVV